MLCFSFGPNPVGWRRPSANDRKIGVAAIGMNGRSGEAAQRHEVRPTGSFGPIPLNNSTKRE